MALTLMRYGAPMVRIVCGDPSGFRDIDSKNQGDAFALVGIELDLDRKAIHIKYAKQWTGLSFLDVAYRFKKDYNKIKPKFCGLETNNAGKSAIRDFQTVGINAHGINTVSNLNASTRHRWQAMDKTFTVQYLKQMRYEQRVIWPHPSITTRHMRILQDQFASIGEYMTNNGSVGYRAMKGRHDDLFSALLLCVHMARIYIERDEN